MEVSADIANFSCRPDSLSQISENSPRLFVACKQELCTMFVAASRRFSGPVRKACWCGRNGLKRRSPLSSESSRKPWNLVSLQPDVECWVSEIIVYAEKKGKVSEWCLLFQVHGEECIGEMGGVQSRKMRSHGFHQSSLNIAFFFQCYVSSLERELQDHLTPHCG